MVKVKVVNIKPVESASDETQQSEGTKEEIISEPEGVKEVAEEVIQDVIKEVVAEVPPVPEEIKNVKTKKTPATGKCDNCGKEMLMKTLKYSHMKLCMPPVPEAPPPPPPTPAPVAVVEKPKPKRAPAKPKAPVAEAPVAQEKSTFDGVVDFSVSRKVLSHEEEYNQMRQARLQHKQARVKNLISQAI